VETEYLIWSADFLAYDQKAHAAEWLYNEDTDPSLFTNTILLN